jgi:hypothetical protein
MPKFFFIPGSLPADFAALLQSRRPEDGDFNSGQHFGKRRFASGVDEFELSRFTHGYEVFHGGSVRQVIVAEEPKLIGYAIGCEQFGLSRERCGETAKIGKRASKRLAIEFGIFRRCGCVGIDVGVLGPGLDYKPRLTSLDDITRFFGIFFFLSGAESVYMVLVTVGRDYGGQLAVRTGALFPNVFCDLLKHIALVLGSLSSPEIDENVTSGFLASVEKAQQKTVSKSYVIATQSDAFGLVRHDAIPLSEP